MAGIRGRVARGREGEGILQAIGIACSLGGQEVAMVDTAVALHQVDPSSSEALEVGELYGIDHVVHDASDHRA